MAFDGFFVRKLVEEFNESILYSRINKINNLSNDEFIFSIRKGKNLKLYVSANSSASRIQLTNNNYENPQTPSNFCSVLRKYLLGGIIEEINQINNDRIIKFKIKNFDELGYEKYYFLITELMGKHSNIILTNSDNIIIESLKNSYSLEFCRSTISNMEYVLPPTVKKYNPFNFSEYSDLICDKNDKKFLIKNFYGVSSVLNNYFLNREEDTLESFREFCKNFSSYNEPTLLKNGNKNDFYYFDIISNKDNIKFDSLSRLLDFYYMDIQKESSNKNTEKELFNFIKNKLSRLNKKIKILNKELLEAKEKDDFKLKGQLLISNIYLFKNNIPEVVTLQNFYSENLEDISIELDPNISIEKNSEKYFELYKKNKRTIENLYEQIDITKKDISYFETLSFQIENAGKTDLLEIKEELINSGYLKKDKNKKSTKKKNNYLIIKYNGIDIYVGKNNIQNDTITNKLARRDYLWFHAKDIPGSHVVIFDYNPDEETKRVASMLAGYFSKFKNENYVSVDSTLIKNVKKISGAKPGMVTYTDQKTVKQKIDKIFINDLLVKNN